MASTKRLQQVREVALCCVDFPDDPGGERAKFLDIIACRRPIGNLGRKERKLFLWLRIEGPDEVMDRLTDLLEERNETFDKRRFCIPAKRLRDLNVERTQDEDDPYQPFVTYDEETGNWLATARPLRYEGLIFDKITGRYLG